MRCAPRFNYARNKHIALAEQDCIHFEPDCASCPRMTLHASLPAGSMAAMRRPFTLKAGETATFTFGEA